MSPQQCSRSLQGVFCQNLRHNYSTRRNGLDIFVPKISTETAKKGCYCFGAQVLNNLPSSMKETESLLILKTLTKDFYIENS